jgi:signal transduction histidine kinase
MRQASVVCNRLSSPMTSEHGSGTDLPDPTRGTSTELILRSWRRSQEQRVPRRLTGMAPPVVTEEMLQSCLESDAELVEAARSQFADLSRIFSETPHVVCLTNRNGIVLAHTASSLDANSLWLTPGYMWSENRIGTNAAGTALVEGVPVAVRGREHYLDDYASFASFAAPIRGAGNTISGTLLLIVPVEKSGEHCGGLISYVASVIGRETAAREERDLMRTQKALARLSSFMAHELLGPVGSLGMVFELLEQYELSREAKDLVARGLSITATLRSVIEHVRLLGNNEALPPEPVRLFELLRSAVEGMEIGDQHTVTVLPLSEQDAMACPAPHLLAYLIRNLVRNAIEARPEGITVQISARVENEEAVLTVADDGPGLPKNVRETLFRRSVTTKKSGSGIGLILCRTIAEEIYHGTIEYRPNTPRGSVFEVRVPAG